MAPQCPFLKEDELYHGLEQSHATHALTRTVSAGSHSPKNYIPEHPRIDVASPYIGEFLKRELLTADLNTLAPRLWLLATPDSSHISSLSRQIVKGRQIIITENPELHLVWYYDRVFVKPLPKFLLSHAFWECYLCSDSSPIEAGQRQLIRQAATGFIRSYAFLICHRSDFDLAKRDGQRLVPKKVKYSSLIKFLSEFESIPDNEVSPRFHYGELRLSRLNFWAKIFLGRSCYHRVQGQYADRIARVYGPLLFVFAILSLLMAGFQVALAIPETWEPKSSWRALERAAQVTSTGTLVVLALATLYPLMMISFLVIREVKFALKQKLAKRNPLGKEAANGKGSEGRV